MATFKETASTVLILLWTVFVGYIVFYWGFYKGGGYILHHWIAPSVASAHATPPGSTNATAATSSGGTITIDILKTLWTVLATTLGAVAAAFVRRWFVYRTLEDKMNILDAVRIDVLEKLTDDTPKPEAAIALSGGMLRYLFGDKEYGLIARYLSAETSLSILKAISAIDLVAMAARSSTPEEGVKRVCPEVVRQLQQFDLEAVQKQLKLLRDDANRTPEDVTSMAAEK